MAASSCVTCGLDRLLEDPRRWLRGRRFGLVTNRAARGSCGTPGFMLLRQRCGRQLAAVFGPEHGLDANVEDGQPVADAHGGTGANVPPVYSLYETGRRRPTPEMMEGLDLLAVDLQDIGVRYYTYVSTMLECMRAAAAAGIPLMLLDRPNPLGGRRVEGPGVRAGYMSFVAALDVPVRHGMTLGELAMLARAQLGLDAASLEVLPMLGWRPAHDWADTGLIWYPPSPAAGSLNMVRLYPGTCLIEGTNVSEGRGTDAPFELIGAPWLDGDALADSLNRLRTGCRGWWPTATPARFTPRSGKHAGQPCGGVRLEPPRAIGAAVEAGGGPVAFGIALLALLRRTGGGRFAWRGAAGAEGQGDRCWLDVLMGGPETRAALDDGVPWADIADSWHAQEERHRERSAGSLLYRQPDGSRFFVAAVSRAQLDLMSPLEVAQYLVAGAGRAVAAVEESVPQIARAIKLAAGRLAAGGRMIYAGAGTSGRLGVLDASECEPTFGVAPGRVLALIAGGPGAFASSREGAEDDAAAAVADLERVACSGNDVVVGIAASGSTPYTLAALREAARRGAARVAVVGRSGSPLAEAADVAVEVLTGEEPLRGSTRLLAGTAHKVVLNALSTGVFAYLGLVYGDRMVGVQVTNAKLRARAEALIAEMAGVSHARAAESLELARAVDPRLAVRLAILSLRQRCSVTEALARLAASAESLRRALDAAGDACRRAE
ncbi:MAG: N-acetylmuramic acid 6-phosphate etherase [Bacillota bacterium]|nr:N-acetylmuramic acid 6-phosphate etherase [Bacillota bacterium]